MKITFANFPSNFSFLDFRFVSIQFQIQSALNLHSVPSVCEIGVQLQNGYGVDRLDSVGFFISWATGYEGISHYWKYRGD